MTVSGDRKPYLEIDRVEGLGGRSAGRGARISSLELRALAPEVPGRLVFDLDPGPEVAFAAVVAAARRSARAALKQLGLVSFCKTTGGKGLHVVTPLGANARSQKLTLAGSEGIRPRGLRAMARDNPTATSSTWPRSCAPGTSSSTICATTAWPRRCAPLSPRGAAGATVSMPFDLGAGESRSRPQALHHPNRAATPRQNQGLGGLSRQRESVPGRDQATGSRKRCSLTAGAMATNCQLARFL